MLRTGHPVAREHVAPHAPLRPAFPHTRVLEPAPDVWVPGRLNLGAPKVAAPLRPELPAAKPALRHPRALQTGTYAAFCQADLVTAMSILHAEHQMRRRGPLAETFLVDLLRQDPHARRIMAQWLAPQTTAPLAGSQVAWALHQFFLVFSEAMPQETLWLQTCGMPQLFAQLTHCPDALAQLRYDTRGPKHAACTLEAGITALLTLAATEAELSINWHPYLDALRNDAQSDAALGRLLARFEPADIFASEHWPMTMLSQAARCAEGLLRAWPNAAACMRQSHTAWSELRDAVSEMRALTARERHAMEQASLVSDAALLEGSAARLPQDISLLWHRADRFVSVCLRQPLAVQHAYIDAICAPEGNTYPAAHMFAIRRFGWPGLDTLAAPQLARLFAALPPLASGMALPVPTWFLTRAMQAAPDSMVRFAAINQSAIIRRWVADTTGVVGYPVDTALDPPEQALAFIACCARTAPLEAQRLKQAWQARQLQQGLPYLRQTDVAGLSDYRVLQHGKDPESRWLHLSAFIRAPIDARAPDHLARARTRLWYASVGRPAQQPNDRDAALSRALADADRFLETPLIPLPWHLSIAPLAMPAVLKDALRTHTKLEPGLASYLLADKPGAQRHRRTQVGRLWALVQVAQVPEAVICAHHRLFSDLVRAPGAHRWPLAALALVFFALRDDDVGARCRAWLKDRQRSAHPAALLVALHTLATFGLDYSSQPAVGHTLDLLLRARHHADKVILEAQDRFNDARIDLFEPAQGPGDIALMPQVGAVGHILQGPGQGQVARWLLADAKSASAVAASERKAHRRQTIARRLAQAHAAVLKAQAPHLADAARMDVDAALRAYDEAGITPDAQPTKATAWFDIPVHTRHVRDLAGTKVAPLLLTLLQHAHDLPDLLPQSPPTMRHALNRYNAPDDVLAATPALTEPTLWVAWQKKAARRADSRGCAASYAANLDAYEPSFGRVFRMALSAWANGSWHAFRTEHAGLESWLETLSQAQQQSVEAFYQGHQRPLAQTLGRVKGQPYHLIDTDDLLHILFSGQDVDGSCQHLQADPAYNCGLLGRLTDCTKRLIGIRDGRDRIVARSIFYLVQDAKGAPMLYLGPLYVSRKIDKEAALQAVFDYAQSRARDLGLPLAAITRQIWPAHQMSRLAVMVHINGNGMPDYIDGMGIHDDNVCLNFAREVRLT